MPSRHDPIEDTAPLEAPAADVASELRSFGRRRGRKLSPRQAHLLSDLLPQITATPARIADRSAAFKEIWLEIGFGGGEHLLWQAEKNPSCLIVGCEPFEEGVVKVLAGIADKNLGNILLLADDVRSLLRGLPDATFARAFVLFPDPWPKRRHHKRRLVAGPLLGALARVLGRNAELRIGTDIEDYARTMLTAFAAEPRFVWQARGPADWQVRPDDWPETRYEAKAHREGRRCCYLRFRRA